MAECRSCGASVIWTITEKGKKMPIDAEPHPEGTFVKDRVDNDGKHVRFVKEADWSTERRPRYRSHFATCKFADSHRRKR